MATIDRRMEIVPAHEAPAEKKEGWFAKTWKSMKKKAVTFLEKLEADYQAKHADKKPDGWDYRGNVHVIIEQIKNGNITPANYGGGVETMRTAITETLSKKYGGGGPSETVSAIANEIRIFNTFIDDFFDTTANADLTDEEIEAIHKANIRQFESLAEESYEDARDGFVYWISTEYGVPLATTRASMEKFEAFAKKKGLEKALKTRSGHTAILQEVTKDLKRQGFIDADKPVEIPWGLTMPSAEELDAEESDKAERSAFNTFAADTGKSKAARLGAAGVIAAIHVIAPMIGSMTINAENENSEGPSPLPDVDTEPDTDNSKIATDDAADEPTSGIASGARDIFPDEGVESGAQGVMQDVLDDEDTASQHDRAHDMHHEVRTEHIQFIDHDTDEYTGKYEAGDFGEKMDTTKLYEKIQNLLNTSDAAEGTHITISIKGRADLGSFNLDYDANEALSEERAQDAYDKIAYEIKQFFGDVPIEIEIDDSPPTLELDGKEYTHAELREKLAHELGLGDIDDTGVEVKLQKMLRDFRDGKISKFTPEQRAMLEQVMGDDARGVDVRITMDSQYAQQTDHTDETATERRGAEQDPSHPERRPIETVPESTEPAPPPKPTPPEPDPDHPTTKGWDTITPDAIFQHGQIFRQDIDTKKAPSVTPPPQPPQERGQSRKIPLPPQKRDQTPTPRRKPDHEPTPPQRPEPPIHRPQPRPQERRQRGQEFPPPPPPPEPEKTPIKPEKPPESPMDTFQHYVELAMRTHLKMNDLHARRRAFLQSELDRGIDHKAIKKEILETEGEDAAENYEPHLADEQYVRLYDEWYELTRQLWDVRQLFPENIQETLGKFTHRYADMSKLMSIVDSANTAIRDAAGVEMPSTEEAWKLISDAIESITSNDLPENTSYTGDPRRANPTLGFNRNRDEYGRVEPERINIDDEASTREEVSEDQGMNAEAEETPTAPRSARRIRVPRVLDPEQVKQQIINRRRATRGSTDARRNTRRPRPTDESEAA